MTETKKEEVKTSTKTTAKTIPTPIERIKTIPNPPDKLRTIDEILDESMNKRIPVYACSKRCRTCLYYERHINSVNKDLIERCEFPGFGTDLAINGVVMVDSTKCRRRRKA